MKEREMEIIESLDLGRFSKVIDKSKIFLNSDGTYDYVGALNFIGLGLYSLTEIPFQFRTVNGNFDCSFNNLISFNGAPYSINSDRIYGCAFCCTDNNIISRTGIPKKFKLAVSYRLDNNPFQITYKTIEVLKRMTIEQRVSELNFFKRNHDYIMYEKLQTVLEENDLGYGEETIRMVENVKEKKLEFLL